MRLSRWERWSAVSGLLFALCCVGIFVFEPDQGESNAEITAFYNDDGNRTEVFIDFFFILAAALALLWFVNTLAAILKRAEGEPGTWSRLALVGGTVSSVLLIGAGAAWASFAFAVEDADEFEITPDLDRLMGGFGYILFFSGLMASSLLVFATALVTLRTGVLPFWLGWLSVAVAVFMLFGAIFLPFFALIGWVVLVSILLLLPERGERPPAVTT
jgi:hypothetical protein